MKHLKTFNESGYERIIDDDDDFNLDQPHVSNKEKDTKFEEWEKEELKNLANQYDYNFDSYRGGKRFYMTRRDGMLSIQMWKNDDEWYWLNTFSGMYKVSTFDSLYELIVKEIQSTIR